MWNIEKTVKKGDYLYGVCNEHPKASDFGYVLFHRLVVENFLGRLLKDNEVVHHKDEDKKNNDPSNLQVMDKKEHCKFRASVGRASVELTCPNCNKTFLKEKRQIKKGSTPKCSRKCNGEYSRKIQLKEISNA